MRKILFILIMCLTCQFVQAFESIQVPFATTPNGGSESSETRTITGSVSLLENIPDEFFGTWKVISLMVDSTDPFLFESTSVDCWKLEKKNNYLTLSNPESGATATVTLDMVRDNTIKFVRKSDTPYEKVTETPQITLYGENFYGTDTIVIKKYRNNVHVSTQVMKFRVKGIKQSGAKVNDLITK